MKDPVDAEVSIGRRYSLLASAISGRTLEVANGDPGMPAWSDGRTVFVDANSAPQTQLQCVVVQASLICAGSLEPRVLHKLARKPSAARRYLSLEGHRALTTLWGLLPNAVLLSTDPLTAQRTDSPDSSLMLALGSEKIPEPPAAFGMIRPRMVGSVGEDRIAGVASTHVPPQGRQALLRELEDEIGEGSVVDIPSSPVGGGGPIGRLLKRLLGEARSSGTGAPGADAPTHFTRSSNRVSRMGSPTMRRLTVSNDGSLGVVRGFVYPEWNVHYGRYRPEWCTVVELEPEDGDRSRAPSGDTRSLRRALARLGTELERHRRQPQGEDLDLDAAVESYVDSRAGGFSDDAVYVESQRSRRDLSALVLLDISGSAGEQSRSGGIVHGHQLSAAADLTVALHEVGDRVALYGFRSQGRSAVHIYPLKRFDDGLSTLTDGRLGKLRPGGFTRLGAAIRHGTSTLEREGGTGRRLLVVLSDGFAYDHGYEGSYGEADARRALSEARHRGIGCLCLSIATTTDAAVLRRVFGTAAHATLGTADEMAGVIAPLFRAALGTAELQRRRSARVTRSTERLSIERSRT
jgi:nitric oxide reductase NorD protein